ncbi:MAG: biopolymer transporter ExbD [Neisseriaceae bacterium]|nr:biopolymer transporter ExbD [Neisseriaceae bacterium]
MNFRNRRQMEEPEINFIPLIDLLLVILIFLMITTTYNKMNGFQVMLPEANAPESTVVSDDILLAVKENSWLINGEEVSAEELHKQLAEKAKNMNENNWVIIAADGKTDYANVIKTMEIANQAGINRITLQSQKPQEKQ